MLDNKLKLEPRWASKRMSTTRNKNVSEDTQEMPQAFCKWFKIGKHIYKILIPLNPTSKTKRIFVLPFCLKTQQKQSCSKAILQNNINEMIQCKGHSRRPLSTSDTRKKWEHLQREHTAKRR